MKFLSKKEVCARVLYSSPHIARLEKANRFPKRIPLGTGRRCRVGWLESEILGWMRAKLDGRTAP